jgi:hypothetical protein
VADTGTSQPTSLGHEVLTGAQASNHDAGHPPTAESPSGLAHPLKPLRVTLNDGWRVVEKLKPEQWVLQKRSGNSRSKNPGWECRAFCHTRDGLLLRVRELCGEVLPDALAIINALPEDISES